MSKIQTWKRITTLYHCYWLLLGLYLICQRYKLESESQLSVDFIILLLAVFNMSKIQTWKRITTYYILFFKPFLLYLICQRYKLESESQPIDFSRSLRRAVFNMSKIQTWKRITTYQKTIYMATTLYLICQRYKLESESQPTAATRDPYSCCI